jgi:hypothetical protein
VFVVDKVALGQVSPSGLQFSPPNSNFTIPLFSVIDRLIDWLIRRGHNKTFASITQS